jgi:hypothetical protein
MSSQGVATHEWEADLNAYGATEEASNLNGESDFNYWYDGYDDEPEIIRRTTRRPRWEDELFDEDDYWNMNEESAIADKNAPVGEWHSSGASLHPQV